MPIDAYRGDGTTPALTSPGLRVTPGGADALGRVARPLAGVRRTLELGGLVYAVGGHGVTAYEPAALDRVASLAY